MSVGIKNETIDTTAIIPPAVTLDPDLPDLPEPQEDWTEEQRIAYIKQGLNLNDRLGEESKTSLKKSAKVAFRVGQVLHHELKNRGTELAVGDWAKKHGISGVKWTRGREALRLYWRCDTAEKRAELETLTITQARRKYQVRYAQFIEGRYKPKPKPGEKVPVVDQLQDALVRLMTILEAATPDDWHKAEDQLGPVSNQIDGVTGKLAEVKQVIDGIVPLGQRAEPEKPERGRKDDDAETPKKTPRRRRQKVGDDRS